MKAAPVLFGLALCAVPLSIAVAECFLFTALLFHISALARGHAKLRLPRVFWFWIIWAVLELLLWIRSGAPHTGRGEITHLLLIAALFVLTPVLPKAADQVTVWCGIACTATLGSAFLIGHFLFQLVCYHGPLDPVVYLRGGGLLHHWMIYGTIEILVLAGLLELWHYFPEKHWWLRPVLIVNTLAMLMSLTRMVWICAALLLVIHLLWHRSRWIWAVPMLLCAFFLLGPKAVRSRVTVSIDPDYYSNAERLQMLRVGWRMIRRHPFTGVGPGRVEELYTTYLSASDPIPAYHGHLHNNLVQLAAEFGLPVAGAALIFVAALFLELRKRCKRAIGRHQRFLCFTGRSALVGFTASGFFDYTYGHSLGLILLSFAVFSALIPDSETTISAATYETVRSNAA